MSHCEGIKKHKKNKNTCGQTQREMLGAISEPHAIVVKTVDLPLNIQLGSGVLTCDQADSHSSHWQTGC